MTRYLILIPCLFSGLVLSTNAYSLVIAAEESFSVYLNGDYEIQLRERTGDTERLGIEYDDLEIHIGAEYEIGESVSVFANLEIDYKSEADNPDSKNTLDEAWLGVGLDQDNKLIVGKALYATDFFYVGDAVEMDSTHAFYDNSTSGDDVIRLDFKNPNIEARLSLDLAEGRESEVKDESSVDLFSAFSWDQWRFAGAFQAYKESSEAEQRIAYGVIGSYQFPGIKAELEYSHAESEAEYFNAALTSSELYGPKIKVALGYGEVSPDRLKNIGAWYLTHRYFFNSKVSAFIELGGNNASGHGFGYLTGMRVKF